MRRISAITVFLAIAITAGCCAQMPLPAGTAYEVNVTWDAPSSSPDPVAGYNVYRSPAGVSAYSLQANVASTQLAYTDSNGIAQGQSWDYIVESVDAAGNESVPSNVAFVAIPGGTAPALGTLVASS